MNLREISSQIEAKLSEIFSEELTSGLAAREDSRAFGAMVEKKIADMCRSWTFTARTPRKT